MILHFLYEKMYFLDINAWSCIVEEIDPVVAYFDLCSFDRLLAMGVSFTI